MVAPEEPAFKDTGDAILVTVPLCGSDAATCTVRATADSLDVKAADGACLAAVTQLYGTVDASAVTASAEDGGETLVIRLPKLDATPWPALAATPGTAAPSLADEEASAAAALAERERVSALMTAARDGDLDALAAAAAACGGPAALAAVKDGRGRTALHFAAAGQAGAVTFLIDDQGMDPNVLDEEGDAPLSVAAAGGEAGVVALLLSKGADPNLAGSVPPLCRAAGSGDVATVEALLAAGAPVEAASPAGTPLLWAAGSGNADAVRCLLDAGADAKAAAPDGGMSGVLLAVATECMESLDALLAAGADAGAPAAGGVTPLHVAAETGNLPALRALLAAGADANAADEGGHTPIDAAAEAGFREAVVELLPRATPRPGAAWSADALLAVVRKEKRGGGGGGGAAPHATPASLDGAATPPTPHPDPSPDAAAAHKRAGDEAFVGGDAAGAATAYEASLAHDPGSAVVWANRSAALLALGDAPAALAAARAARERDASYAKAWYREGAAARALGRWEDAAAAFSRGSGGARQRGPGGRLPGRGRPGAGGAREGEEQGRGRERGLLTLRLRHPPPVPLSLSASVSPLLLVRDGLLDAGHVPQAHDRVRRRRRVARCKGAAQLGHQGGRLGLVLAVQGGQGRGARRRLLDRLPGFHDLQQQGRVGGVGGVVLGLAIHGAAELCEKMEEWGGMVLRGVDGAARTAQKAVPAPLPLFLPSLTMYRARSKGDLSTAYATLARALSSAECDRSWSDARAKRSGWAAACRRRWAFSRARRSRSKVRGTPRMEKWSACGQGGWMRRQRPQKMAGGGAGVGVPPRTSRGVGDGAEGG